MPYEKDIYGNVIGTGGDDTSLQNAKMAGYPGYNMFDKQRDAAVLTQGEIEGKTGVNLGAPAAGNGTAVATSSPTSGAALSKYINGEQLTPEDAVALDKLSGGGRPKVLGADKGDEELLRARAGLPALETAGGAASTTIPRYTPITSTEQLAAAMGYTSPEEEKRLRKASVTNQRILAIGDALRHIGNIANTVRYAPSQQFNSPVTDERARYEKGKALRDKANATLLTYQQQKARQDALQRRWENELEYKRQKDEAAAKHRAQVAKDNKEKWQAQQRQKKENDDRNYEFKKEQDKWRREQGQQRIDISASKASGGGSRRSGGVSRRTVNGKTVYEFWDKNGNHHTSTTVAGIGALVREYAPEIPMTIGYTKEDGTKGTRQTTIPERVGDANSRYRERGNKGNTNVNKGKTTSKGSQGSKGGSGKTQGKTTAKGKGGYGNGTRSALNKIIGGK